MILGELVQKIGFQVDDAGLHGLHEKLEGIHKTIGLLAGIEIVHGLYELAERFAGMGEHLEAASIAAGLTTTELQKLQYAASQNAVGADELAGGLAKLNRLLYAGQQGSKQAVATFARLGITQEQLQSFENSSDALAAVQDSLGKVSNATERQAIVMQLFGRGSSNMIKFLLLGSKATTLLGEDAEKMGAVVSEQGVEALAEFEDAASGLGLVIKSFLATVGSKLGPVFVQIIKTFEHQWARSLPMVQKYMETFAHRAAYALGFVTESIRLLVKLVIWFAEDHAGLLLFIAKWAPAVLIAAEAFEVFTNALKKMNSGWQAVTKYAPPAWRAMLWGIEKLQYLAFVVLEKLANGLMVFTPGLAARIRLVAMSLAGLTPVQFLLAVAAIGALAVALHDLYEYFFNDVPFEKLWIGRLLKRAEPIISRLRWLLKPFKSVFMLGDMDADDPGRGMTVEETEATMRSGPMSRARYMPELFDGARDMGVKFDPNDPTLAPGNNVTSSIALNSPITVNVPPGMSTEDSIRVAREGVQQTLLDMLNSAASDHRPAAAR